MKFKSKLLTYLVYGITNVLAKITSCAMFLLAFNIILPKLKQTHQNLIDLMNTLHDSLQQFTNGETNKNKIDQNSKQSSKVSTDHRLILIKDTLNFNLCSQSDLVRIIQDIQQLKQLNPQQQSFNLSYSKMVFKTILQEREDGNLLQQFSEFEYLNEILDSEQITLNITQLEIDYLFDERLETYYNHPNQTDYPGLKNIQIDNYVYNRNEQPSILAPRNSINENDINTSQKAILPSIFIHKKLFVSFILFQNYNFLQFSFQKDSNLEYTQAFLVQNQSYIDMSNTLNLLLPTHILVFHSKKTFNQYIQTNFKLLLWIQVFDKKISPYIHYLKQYTLMDIWLDD